MAIYIDDVGGDVPLDQAAVKEYVDSQVTSLLAGAPAALNTLKELSDAINNDPAFAANLLANLASKLNVSGGTVTGPITLPGSPTQPLQAATKGYVDTAIANIPDPVTSLSSLTDVSISDATSGQVLAFNGTNWYAANAEFDGGGTSISSAVVNTSGHLIVTLSTGDVIDAGYVKGDTGLKGDKGDTGLQGIQGLKGDKGDAGSQGIQGIQGIQGTAGTAGSAGIGVSSAVVDSNGNLLITLTSGNVINAGSSVGPKGDKGDAGVQGIQGPAGTSYSLNGVADDVQVYGLSSTSQFGYDLEVDLANKANKLATPRNIALSGKVTGLTTFDGSGNVTMLTALNGVTTSDVTEGTNQYFTQARARSALSAGTGLSFNAATGIMSLNANSDQVSEGANNLYFTNNRFDNRLGASNLAQLADVAGTVPTTGQALIWNGNVWTPGTVSGGGGGGTSSGVYKATVQVDYDASGNLSNVSILDGSIGAVIATATSTTATVTFTFLGSTTAPLGIQVYGYQRTSNVYVTRALASDFPTRTVVGGGSSGSPSAFSNFDAANNTMTLGLTKAATGASAGVGQTTHCVIQFLLSSI